MVNTLMAQAMIIGEIIVERQLIRLEGPELKNPQSKLNEAIKELSSLTE